MKENTDQQYSKDEINEIQTNLKQLESELTNFESKNDETKKDIFSRIINHVDILVTSGHLEIKRSDISAYVYSTYVVEKNISYDRSHLRELCKSDQKRNYSNEASASIHEHDFKQISTNNEGTWEQCHCGTNRINKIIQINDTSQVEKDIEKSSNKTIQNIIEPTGISFQYLKLVRELYQSTISTIDMCFTKCTINKTTIEKQAQKNEGHNMTPQEYYTNLLKETENLANQRISIVNAELSHITQADLDKIQSTISQLSYIKTKLNDKTKLTEFERSFAKILIERFTYDKSTIAEILNISSKHVKNIILKDQQSILRKFETLERLEFLKRCPECGIGIADHIEQKYTEFLRTGSTTKSNDMENFSLPTYATQCSNLIEDNRILKENLAESEKMIQKMEQRYLEVDAQLQRDAIVNESKIKYLQQQISN